MEEGNDREEDGTRGGKSHRAKKFQEEKETEERKGNWRGKIM